MHYSFKIALFSIFLLFNIHNSKGNVTSIDSLVSPYQIGLEYYSPKLDSLESYFKNIIHKAHLNNNQNTLALANIYLADTYRYKSNIKRAIIHIEEARRIINSNHIDQWKVKSNYYTTKGAIIYFRRDYEMVLKLADSSLSVLRDYKLDSLGIGRAYSLKYSIYNTTYQYDSALFYLEKSLVSLPKKRQVKNFYINLRRLIAHYRNTGQIEKAEATLFKALNESDALVPDQKSISYQNLGEHFKSSGDYSNGLHYYKKMLENDSIHGIKNTDRLISAYLDIAEIFKLQSEHLKAIRWTLKVLTITNQLNPCQKNTIYNELGRKYKSLGKYNMAKKYFIKSINLDKMYDLSSQPMDMCFAYIYLGDLKANYLYDKSGINDLEKGIVLLKKYYGDKSVLLRYPYSYMSKAYRKLFKEYNKSLEYLNKAHSYNSTLFENYLPFQKIPSTNKNNYINSLYDFEKRIVLISDWIKSKPSDINVDTLYNSLLYSIESYIETEEILRIKIRNQQSKITRSNLSKSNLHHSSQALKLLYNETKDTKHLEYLFLISSRYKSISLEEILIDSKAKFDNIPDSIINNEIIITTQIGELNHHIENERKKERFDKQKIAELQKSLDETISIKHQYELGLESSYPEYYKLKHDKKVFTINDIQRSLSKDRVLIEYSILNDSTLNMFAITKNEFKFFSLIDTVFIKNTDKLIDYLSISNFINLSSQRLSDFKSTSYYLYTKLLQPFSQLIEGKKLIINPDDKLWYLPFEILLTDSATNIKNFRNLPYLIKDHPISYAYSTKLYFDKNEDRSPNSGNVLSIVPSYDASINYIDELLKENTKRDQLRPLPNSIKEAEYVNKALGGKLLKGNDASEKNFKNLADKYKILHLAMHAVIDNNNPDYSKLIFTHGVDTTEDNYLNTYEIYNNRLNADLAVLSSCNSGSGKMQKGEGIISIARAFLYAGCPSLVTTLWSVDDASSAKLMQYFYENLKDGMSKSVALQQAKLKFIEKASPLQQHPYFWASYTQIGNDEPIELERKTSAYIWITIVVIFLISSYFLLRKQKAKQA